MVTGQRVHLTEVFSQFASGLSEFTFSWWENTQEVVDTCEELIVYT